VTGLTHKWGSDVWSAGAVNGERFAVTGARHGASSRTRTVALVVVGALVLLVAAGLVGTRLLRDEDPRGLPSPVPVPRAGTAYFGTEFSASLPDRAELVQHQESQLGRQFDIEHVYHKFDDPFPSDYDRTTVGEGRTLFLTWSCSLAQGGSLKWQEVASGEWDDVIDRRARDVQGLGQPILMSFCHEPGGHPTSSGSPSDYVAAWRHIVERFRQDGVTNVAWVWTLTAYSFRTGTAGEYFPGDEWVSWVGVDGYTNIACPWLTTGWTSWNGVFGAANAFARDHGLPLIVAEFSLREDPVQPDRKGQWLASSLTEMRSMSQLRAVVAFNSTSSCSSYVVSSPQSLEGYRTLARSSFFDARPTDDPSR